MEFETATNRKAQLIALLLTFALVGGTFAYVM